MRTLPLSLFYLLVFITIGVASASQAHEVNISDHLPHVDVMYDSERIRIERIQDTENLLNNSFAKTSRKCPPFCIQPLKAAPGVTTVSELELLDFLMTDAKKGQGLLVDARTDSWYKKGTIPGSINIPFTIFISPDDDPVMIKIFKAIGGVPNAQGSWDFSAGKKLLVFCNGPWCQQSIRAIKGLMRHGYPPEKLYYYRGGMQSWQSLGLTTVVPKK